MGRGIRLSAILVACFAFALARGGASLADSKFPEERVGRELQEFALPFLSAGAHDQSDTKSTATLSPARARVVLFWASWCPYCKEARRFLDALQKKYERSGLSVVGISTDESREAALSASRKYASSFPDAYAGPARFKELTLELPVMVVMDEKGRTRAAYSGFSGERAYDLKKQLRPLLGLVED